MPARCVIALPQLYRRHVSGRTHTGVFLLTSLWPRYAHWVGQKCSLSARLSYTCCPVGWEQNLLKFMSRIRSLSLVPIRFWVRSGMHPTVS